MSELTIKYPPESKNYIMQLKTWEKSKVKNKIVDRLAAASKKARAFLAILILYISAQGQNSITYKTGIENIRLKFYSTATTGKFEDINRVDVENDTLYEFSKLQYVYDIQNNDFALLTDIWNVLKQNGFTLTALVKPSYNKAVSEHTTFNTAHTALYPVTGSSTTAIINLYKNYMIRSTQADNLRNIIEMININGFKIKVENNTNFETAVNAYNNYHQQIKL
jgi:hypothetical protein